MGEFVSFWIPVHKVVTYEERERGEGNREWEERVRERRGEERVGRESE